MSLGRGRDQLKRPVSRPEWLWIGAMVLWCGALLVFAVIDHRSVGELLLVAAVIPMLLALRIRSFLRWGRRAPQGRRRVEADEARK